MSEHDEQHSEVSATEAIAAMISMATMSRAYYAALQEEGWTEEEAFKLTLGWQHAVSGGRGPS
jgi:roadblock/LC7 domain-containing protein